MRNPFYSRQWSAYLFLAPGLLFYSLFLFLPAMATLAFSLTHVDRFTWDVSYVGIDNLAYVLTDGRFWVSFANTFLFIVMAVAGNVGLGLLLAVLIDRAMPRAVLFFLRLAYFLPVLVATALVSLVWKLLYSTDLGILNYYLGQMGVKPVGWLTDARVAMVSIVIMDVWKHIGFFMIIMLAALQAIPRPLIEVARLDGAGFWQMLWNVKLPMIAPVVLFCATYATITGLQVFDSIRILTVGGPGDATMSMVLYMYEQTFGAQDVGAGSAAAFLLMTAIVITTIAQMRVGRRAATARM